MASKAESAEACVRLAQIPNIGPAMVADFHLLGIERPEQLRGQNAFRLYSRLCELTHARHDPCVLDTFLAAVDFMDGAPPLPWWHYTAERKRLYPAV
ncbi:MAG: helix-hairpin-helix domain-containing protein [Paucibacter sp.]|nr:helix-hairpin-helix domain-containing protein [Roseateles sp.]